MPNYRLCPFAYCCKKIDLLAELYVPLKMGLS